MNKIQMDEDLWRIIMVKFVEHGYPQEEVSITDDPFMNWLVIDHHKSPYYWVYRYGVGYQLPPDLPLSLRAMGVAKDA